MLDLGDNPSAATLGRAIAAGEADPVEIAQGYLDRIGTHYDGGAIYARLTPERALAEAEAARDRARAGRRRGPLDGVPLSWKDLFDSAGVATESGSKLLKGRVPERDAEALANASAGGTVCLGKTHMSELAFSGLGLNPSSATSPNAVMPGHAPGGSSSGAAASVAFGLAPAAIGSDTGGSVRLPSAWNDLVGFKPTHGAVSTVGAVPLVERFDTVGPLARTVEDCALIHALLQGTPAPDLRGATLEGVRLAVLKTVAMEDLEDAPAHGFESAVDRLRSAGARIERIELPLVEDAVSFAIPLYSGEAWAIWGERIEANPGAVYHQIERRIRLGEATTAREFINAWRTLTCLRRDWGDALAGYDAAVMPTCPILPPDLHRLETEQEYYIRANVMALRNTRIGNMLGCAGVSLPTGVPACGLQMLIPGTPDGAGDARLLRLAAAAEEALS